MRVAIIDSVLSADDAEDCKAYYHIQDGRIEKCSEYVNYYPTHASVCRDIIKTLGGTTSELIQINILGETNNCDIKQLIIALRWCLDNHIDIINLSNGVTSFVDDDENYCTLYQICSELSERNVVIVAAQNNEGLLTIPAHFPMVLSVEAGIFRRLRMESIRRSDIYVFGSLKKKGCKYRQYAAISNSYAAAFFTAYLLKKGEQKRKLIAWRSCLLYFRRLQQKPTKKKSYRFFDVEVPVITLHVKEHNLIGNMMKRYFQEKGYSTVHVVWNPKTDDKNSITVNTLRQFFFICHFYPAELFIFSTLSDVIDKKSDINIYESGANYIIMYDMEKKTVKQDELCSILFEVLTN